MITDSQQREKWNQRFASPNESGKKKGEKKREITNRHVYIYIYIYIYIIRYSQYYYYFGLTSAYMYSKIAWHDIPYI